MRLKSGDGGIFGRLEEELAALRAEALEFEIIPGVPSACAAAAEAGIPLTRRLDARRVQFITGHDVAGNLPDDLNVAALADAHATTVVYMGRRTFADLAGILMAHGLPGDTRALMAEGVTTGEQSIGRYTVAELASRLRERESGHAPTLILYGALSDG